MADLFEETITLSPSPSLALRQAFDAMKADDSIYHACPPVVRDAICDFMMPPYSSAETAIADLKAESESRMQLAEKFARKIKDLEAKLDRRSTELPSTDLGSGK